MHRVEYFKRKNRYGNVAKKTEYRGVYYHSKLEADYAAELDFRVKAKDIKSWERQVRVPIIADGVHFGEYVVDFLIHHNDGSFEYVECKGRGLGVGMNKFRWLEKKNLKVIQK